MTHWGKGEAEIERLLDAGELQRVQGGQADGAPWLDKAHRTYATAKAIVGEDPESSFTLAYDAARFACTALLAQQGLRSTTKGGHLAIETAVRAQFGPTFKPYRALRMRRNEIEYPAYPDDVLDRSEAAEAVNSASALITAAEKLLPSLALFG